MSSTTFPTKAAVSVRALLGAPTPRPRYYRRSTTTKAPRKRTFVNLIMEKHSPGVRSAGSGSALCKASASSCNAELLQACCGGNNNTSDGGSGSGNNRSLPPRGGNGGFGGASGGGAGAGGEGQPQPVPRALVVGAAALMAALVLLPSQQAAASGPLGQRRGTLRVAGSSTAATNSSSNNVGVVAPGSPRIPPRSMCLNHHGQAGASAAAAAEGAIVYGHVALSEAERRLLTRSSRQLFFTECMRVGSGAARVGGSV